MQHKFWYRAPIAITHIGWWVDGKRLPLNIPVQCAAGARLTVSFEGKRPETVRCLMDIHMDGKVLRSVERAFYEP